MAIITTGQTSYVVFIYRRLDISFVNRPDGKAADCPRDSVVSSYKSRNFSRN